MRIVAWIGNTKKIFWSIIFFLMAGFVVVAANNVDDTTNKMIVSYIESHGWKIENKPNEVRKLNIPKCFDEIYSTYNRIQKLSGFNLEDFRGTRATRYSYKVLNHKEKACNVKINILVAKNQIIGADVSATGDKGFIHEITLMSKK